MLAKLNLMQQGASLTQETRLAQNVFNKKIF